MGASYEMNDRHLPAPEEPPAVLVEAVRKQFLPAFDTLEAIIRTSPENLWFTGTTGVHPLWKRCLHALESVDYHLNDFVPYVFPYIGKNVSPEFDVSTKDVLSSGEMIEYLKKVREKSIQTFLVLKDSMLKEKSSEEQQLSYLEILVLQIRHLNLNAGRCIETLKSCGYDCVGWIEREE